MNGPLAGRLLKALALYVQNMTEEQLDGFINDLDAGVAPRPRKATKQTERLSHARTVEIVDRISSAKTRENALEIINSLALSKSDLNKIAHFAHVHVAKEDKISDIHNKIIEALVGSRLSSMAIRGQNT